MFLGAVSGGLVALGLIATAAGVRTAFYAFALILLPTLVFVGLATFNRVLQSGIEDLGYASRIARLRGQFSDQAGSAKRRSLRSGCSRGERRVSVTSCRKTSGTTEVARAPGRRTGFSRRRGSEPTCLARWSL